MGKFFKREPGDFCHDVINARLEARGGFARDVVLEFIEQVADGEFGGDFKRLGSVVLESNRRHSSLTTETEGNAINIGHLKAIFWKPEKHSEFDQIFN